MKKLLLVCGALLAMEASPLTKLFEALKKRPVTQVDERLVQIMKLQKQKVSDRFYPQISLFGSFEHYNSATNLRPVPPTEANDLLQRHEPLPFAQNIVRVGISASMPLFIQELFDLQKKMEYLLQSTRLKKELGIYKNEAILVGSYADLGYMQRLQEALEATHRSLQKSYEDIKIKVQSGRAAPVALDKIASAMDTVELKMQDIAQRRAGLVAKIEGLTGIEVRNYQPISQKSPIKKERIFALLPLQAKLQAQKADLKAAKDRFVPKVLLEAKWSENYAQKDVVFKDDVHRGYGDVAIKVVLPLSKTNFTDIEIERTKLLQQKAMVAKTRMELQAQAEALEEQLHLNDQKVAIAKQKVKRQQELLRYAKTAFEVGRLTEEEYLRYEDSLLSARADLAKALADKWRLLAQLAFIYGNDLERIVE